jgi:xanthine dehydrogenase molybdopterin-binding subunit B
MERPLVARQPSLHVSPRLSCPLLPSTYLSSEELVWARDGHLRTRNVSTYKLPSHDSIPLEWNVHLLPDNPNNKGIHLSRSVGEAGLQLGVSVMHAIKDALYAAREDKGKKGREREERVQGMMEEKKERHL